MIAVTGEPRSGTSLTMIILKELGLDIAGEKFISDTTREANPDGVYEIPRVAKNGLSMDMYLGRTPLCPKIAGYEAIKLVTYGLTSSDPNIFTKILVCVRNPIEVAKSQYKRGYRPHTTSLANDITLNYIQLLKWLGMHRIPFHVVDYNSMIQSPLWEVCSIASFVDHHRFTSEDTTKAAKAVKPEYHRERV